MGDEFISQNPRLDRLNINILNMELCVKVNHRKEPTIEIRMPQITSRKITDQPRFLPITTEELKNTGKTTPDIILVSADAYVDHPSFAAALIGRTLYQRRIHRCRNKPARLEGQGRKGLRPVRKTESLLRVRSSWSRSIR